jgi:hypothetical protein
MAARALNKKSCTAFKGQISGVISVNQVVHVAGTFDFASQNSHQSYKWKSIVRLSRDKLPA